MKAKADPNKNKEVLIQELWHQLTNKITEEWEEKYLSYGLGLSQLKSPTKFAQALHSDIYKQFKARNVKANVVNHLTIHSYFKQGGFSANAKVGTLDLFCKYLGYERWTDFVQKNKDNLSYQDAHIQPAFASVEQNTYRNKKWWIPVLSGLVLLLGGFFIFSQFSPHHTAAATNEKLYENIIREAAQLEFSLYKAVPNIQDTALLKKHFTQNGSAKQSILGSLNRAIRNNRKLRIPPSAFDILEVNFVSKSKDKVTLKTEERWHVLWYDTENDKDERLYDEVNQQTYILVKEDDVWKIQTNVYKGEPKEVLD